MQKSSSCNFGGPGETKTPKNVSGNMQLPKCAFVEGKKVQYEKRGENTSVFIEIDFL